MIASADEREEAGDDLRRGYRDAIDRFAAVDEVLRALGRSTSDPDSVLDSVVRGAQRLCRADAAIVCLTDGDEFVVSSSVGLSEEYLQYVRGNPIKLNRDTLIGRSVEDRAVEQIADVLEDRDYGRPDVQRIAGFRTVLSAPMIIDGDVVGALCAWRTAVQPFGEREIALLESFAAPAAVVVRNVHLVQALEERGIELARKIEQLEALSQVGDAVSSSLVLDEVLSTVISHAVRLSGSDGGSVMEYLGEERRFTVRAAYASSDELLERLRATEIALDATVVGQAAKAGHPVAIPDLGAVPRDPHLELLYADGWRSLVAAPVVHGDRILGALVVRRRTAGEYPAETIDFLENFARQSAVAVWNAQLFHELERKSAELEIASRHKSEFLASMSHELRTPLNAVIGFSEVLLERMFGDLNERQDEYLRDILGSGRHLLQLLNDILDLSRVEAGRMELEPSTFAVGPAVEYAASMVRERAARHDLTVTLDLADDLGDLESDSLRFTQVLVNLLSNAVKFTPDGGSVTVTARRDSGDLVVTIADTGIGIAAEDRERIFESFQQGRRGPQRAEGTGLGLALCRRIVDLLGGRMWFESEVGRGSTFGFSVPIPAMPDRTAAPEGSLPIVVVVDDDHASSDLVAAYLDGEGVEVMVARDGEAGLALIRGCAPVAIVLDIRLPRRDGWSVLQEVRVDARTRETPVVIASILDERARGLASGASEYLVKPIARDELIGALRRAGVPLARRHPTREDAP